MRKTYTINTTKIKPRLKQAAAISGKFVVPNPPKNVKKPL